MSDKPQHCITPLEGCLPEIGRALAMLEDCRQRTRQVLANLNPAAVDWVGGMNGHSIGTLLYHIAAIEVSWLGIEVTQGRLPDEVWDHFETDVCDPEGHLTPVSGQTLDEHWQRLDYTRGLLLDVYKKMSLEDYRYARCFDEYDVTPEWVLYHLMQHEAGHRDELAALRAAAETHLKTMDT